MIQSLTLIGVGLIGGSFALDLKRKGLVQHVYGVDIDPANIERALERRVIDEGFTELNATAAGADVVVLATPVRAIHKVIQELAPLLGPNTIVTDVGSTKRTIIHAYETYLPTHLPLCVAAHPIAGSDRSGAMAAQFGLFQQKKVVLCAHEQQNPSAYGTLKHLWQSVGAVVHELDAHTHDQIFAAVSHLPHLLAYAFVNQIASADDAEAYFDFAASGFRDFTRIASSQPDIWADITMANQDILLTLIEAQQQQLSQLHQLIAKKDAPALKRYYAQAKKARDDWQDHQPS
ncbi:MAG: prephenate dehydrogenase/arogenate dehydrogenase family protein [Neisseriaceae bacterium]|nr:prephenate dehydrogenase/arogenate dehydrogenase family protein [Neisseriaceae bacterium]MBP6862025.1 prephenate dehydrogenase/arogenate dehydrogenase family protein [Neisseriaceae bacterium]